MTKAEILLEKVCVKKMGCNTCSWCLWLLLHSNEENEKSLFSGQCRWLQTPTPVLPMIRKSAMWNFPNPMVSTASSTVNVFCPEHQRERQRQKTCQQSNCTSFLRNVNIFPVTVAPHQEKGWKHLPVVCPQTSPCSGVAETAARGEEGRLGMEAGQPCLELTQLLQKPMAWTTSGQWSAPFPCPNCHDTLPLCIPGLRVCSWHGWCELGAAPALSPAR